jgi:signal transduction histidine kinase
VAFASAAHEFRNPLNGIVTSLELLKDDINQDRGGQLYYTTAMNCTKLMLFLVKDILDFSQIESRSFILNYETCEIEPMIEECIDLFRFKAKEKRIALGYTIGKGPRKRKRQSCISAVPKKQRPGCMIMTD